MIYRTLLFISLLLACVAALSAQDTERPYFTLMGKADEAIKDGDWQLAEELLVRAIGTEPSNPSNVMLMSNLGMVRFNSGQDSLALLTLDDAHRMAPRSVTVLRNRASVLSALGKLDEAMADYRAIMEIDSLAMEPYFYHGMTALRNGDVASALDDFTYMERHAPSHRLTAIGMSSVLTATGRYREAIPYLNRVLSEDPQVEFFSARALCHLMTENLSEASADIASGMVLDPQNGELYLYRAILNKMRFRNDDAKADAKRAAALGIDPARIRPLLTP